MDVILVRIETDVLNQNPCFDRIELSFPKGTYDEKKEGNAADDDEFAVPGESNCIWICMYLSFIQTSNAKSDTPITTVDEQIMDDDDDNDAGSLGEIDVTGMPMPTIITGIRGKPEDINSLIELVQKNISIIKGPPFGAKAADQMKYLYPETECYGSKPSRAFVQHTHLVKIKDDKNPECADLVEYLNKCTELALGPDGKLINHWIALYKG